MNQIGVKVNGNEVLKTLTKTSTFVNADANTNANAEAEGSTTGPSCSKLTTSLVNDSLKFTSSDTQIC